MTTFDRVHQGLRDITRNPEWLYVEEASMDGAGEFLSGRARRSLILVMTGHGGTEGNGASWVCLTA